MATFHFDLVSPEKLLFSGEVDQVDVPGTEGDFGVLAGHAPLITTLRPGILDDPSRRRRACRSWSRRLRRGDPAGPDHAGRHRGAGEDFDAAVLADEIKDTEEDVADAKDDWKRDKLAHSSISSRPCRPRCAGSRQRWRSALIARAVAAVDAAGTPLTLREPREFLHHPLVDRRA